MAREKINVVVLVSGGGTNLQAILDAQKSGRIAHAQIVGVIADNPAAYALTRADKNGIPFAAVDKSDYADKTEFERHLRAAIDAFCPDLIVLAGFLTILSSDFVADYPERIINVHPSLIPAFCGKGFYGLRVHEEALRRGVKVTGATVHFVNEITDGGDIIAQKAVEVLPGDTPETLQRRVMEQAEWILLPQALEQVAGEIAKKREEKQ